jgi:antagonist of KipI
MSFVVQRPGTRSTLVDLGRPGSRSLGVSVGGAADRTAYRLANALAGNAPDAPALEITLAGPALEATATHGCALFGAPFGVRMGPRTIRPGTSFTVQAGEVLTIEACPEGLRAYLAVCQGFAATPILGSGSALTPLAAGAKLACPPSRIGARYAKIETLPPHAPRTLHYVRGTHTDQLGERGLAGRAFVISPQSDRMGLRLTCAEPFAFSGTTGVSVSAPVCPGTVQVTPNGQAIVLGVDAQTIGGYLRAGHVIAADLDQLAQLRPGEMITFEEVTLDEAQARWRRHEAWLRQWETRLRVSARMEEIA